MGLSIQTAVAFGFLTGITLFILYLSILAHRPQQSILSHSSRDNANIKESMLRKPTLDRESKPIPDHLVKADVFVKKEEKSNIEKAPIREKEAIMDLDAGKAELKKKIDFAANKLMKLSEMEPDIACVRMKKKYNVASGVTWGTMPAELQKRWSEIECDKRIAKKEKKEQTPVEEKPSLSESEKSVEETHVNEAANDEKWCYENKEKFGVQPMKSWGKLPESYYPLWKEHNCDAVFTGSRLKKVSVANCKHIPNHYTNEELPLIAIMAATTTRGIRKPTTRSLALFKFLLPTLIRTVDCGFRYEYVLGYDVGDPFYDSESGLKEVKTWFEKRVEGPMRENGIQLKLRLVKVRNTLKKPGPVFIEMARAAYEAGAMYYYRINDDTELSNNWPTIFVKTLNSLSIPYGVVGPFCAQGNDKILTHDFVHRLHMEIFEMNYYPPQLTDWWMDDWISFVYGQTRTFKARSVQVVHHTGEHGKRYEVDETHAKLLDQLILEGRQKIRNYMLKHNVDENLLQTFDKDNFRKGFTHRDIPISVQNELHLK